MFADTEEKRFLCKNISGGWKHQGLKVRVSYDCNLKCRHCYIPKELYIGPSINYERFKNVIEKVLSDDTIKYVTAIGGEPTVDMEALQILVDACDRHNKIKGLITNGLRMYNEPDVLKQIKSMNFDAIGVSYNDYLLEQVDQVKIVNTLAKYFQNNEKTVFFPVVIAKENKVLNSFMLNREAWSEEADNSHCPDLIKCWKLYVLRMPAGRGADIPIDAYVTNGGFNNLHRISCSPSLEIDYDGNFFVDCRSDVAVFYDFANADDFTNVDDLYNMLSYNTVHSSEPNIGFTTFCERRKHNMCFKKEFKEKIQSIDHTRLCEDIMNAD